MGLVLVLLFLSWTAGRMGFASLLSAYAARSNRIDAANAAVQLNASDAEAHYIRAAILEFNNDPVAANAEYVQAVILHPFDYVVWLALAHTRELNGDINGAIDAAGEATRLAPFYAQPHWQLGNLLVRAGRSSKGFDELRLAAASNPSLRPAIIDLAWQLSHGDVDYVRRVIQPETAEESIDVAEYFKKHGKFAEAVDVIRVAGAPADEYCRRFTAELISAKRFQDAYTLWSIGHPRDSNSATLTDGGFEQPSDLDEPGFGWRANKTPNVMLSLDGTNPKEGKSSLKVEFNGDSDPKLPIITQLVNVEPRAHYKLLFAVRTEELISGGLPGLKIFDPAAGQSLAQSGAFPTMSRGWQDYAVEFVIPEGASTIQIVLQRELCKNSPCPIFGRLWLDNFSLQKQ
jgi:hypothetical protein